MNIDHKAEALRISAADNEWTIGWETADAQHLSNIAEAQVHATLYAADQTAALVEQQRIANLLVWLGDGEAAPANSEQRVLEVRANRLIREGLGL